MNTSNPVQLYLAPLQGFTDYAFRNAFGSLFGAPHKAFSPFIETHKPDKNPFRDVLPERNSSIHLVPQIIGNNATEMIPVIQQLQDLGYNEINWNLGCPYPMVTKKMKGAGLLPFPETIDAILNEVLAKISCQFSVKMRLGLAQNDEWKALVNVLNKYPLHEVIVHARNAKQMYKGDTDIASFIEFSKQLKHPVCYNGNIFTYEDYQNLSAQLPHISRWMLGRGIMANPMLFKEIVLGEKVPEGEIIAAIGKLHDQLLFVNSERLNGPSHVLNKMKPYWEYFAFSMTGHEKGLKKIKKSPTLDAYKGACREVFGSF